MNTLSTFYDTVSAILKKNVEKKALFEKIDFIILAADELVEGGLYPYFYIGCESSFIWGHGLIPVFACILD